MGKAKVLKMVGIVSGIFAAIWAVLAWGPWISLFWEMKVMPVFSELFGIDRPYQTFDMIVTSVGNKTGAAILFGIELVLPLILAAVSVVCFVWRKKILKKGE